METEGSFFYLLTRPTICFPSFQIVFDNLHPKLHPKRCFLQQERIYYQGSYFIPFRLHPSEVRHIIDEIFAANESAFIYFNMNYVLSPETRLSAVTK